MHVQFVSSDRLIADLPDPLPTSLGQKDFVRSALNDSVTALAGAAEAMTIVEQRLSDEWLHSIMVDDRALSARLAVTSRSLALAALLLNDTTAT